MSDNENLKVHFARMKLTKRGNYKMFCGKVFSSGDRTRLKRHVTSHIEIVNCPSCIERIGSKLSLNERFVKSS